MYGWRARIGYISPSANDVVGYEFYRMVPDGVVLVSTALSLQQINRANLEIAWNQMLDAANELAKAEVDYIVSAGDPIYTTKGPGSDNKMIQSIKEQTGLPATTSLTSAVEALKTLSVKRVTVATPYPQEFCKTLKNSLGLAGFDVLYINGISEEPNNSWQCNLSAKNFSNVELSKLPFYVPYQMARDAFLHALDAEAIYLPCGRWAATRCIETIENDFRVPVVTAIQSWIWTALRALGIKEVQRGYGKLFGCL